MAFKENLDEFLDEKEGFAVKAVLHFVSGKRKSIKAIFDAPYLNAQLGEYDMETREPRLTCKESDVRSLKRGDAVTVELVGYDVLAVEPDGTGIAIVRLACSP